jgi:hypothetical protein
MPVVFHGSQLRVSKDTVFGMRTAGCCREPATGWGGLGAAGAVGPRPANPAEDTRRHCGTGRAARHALRIESFVRFGPTLQFVEQAVGRGPGRSSAPARARRSSGETQAPPARRRRRLNSYVATRFQRFNLQQNCLESKVVSAQLCLQPLVGVKVLRFSPR